MRSSPSSITIESRIGESRSFDDGHSHPASRLRLHVVTIAAPYAPSPSDPHHNRPHVFRGDRRSPTGDVAGGSHRLGWETRRHQHPEGLKFTGQYGNLAVRRAGHMKVATLGQIDINHAGRVAEVFAKDLRRLTACLPRRS